MRRPPLLTLLVGVLVLAVTGLASGCGSEEPEPYNAADVTFASEMVTHHEQALEMADMAAGRPLRPRVQELVAQVRADQQAEMDQMCDWLEAWGKPAPGRDPGAAMDMGGTLEGMMSHEQMTALEQTPDAAFERAWLEQMVAHHQGAVDLARTEAGDGRFAPAVELARDIEDAQSAEIDRMHDLLAAAG